MLSDREWRANERERKEAREADICRLAKQGWTTRKIADVLGVSISLVKLRRRQAGLSVGRGWLRVESAPAQPTGFDMEDTDEL